MEKASRPRLHSFADVRILRLEMVVGILALCCLGLIGFMMWERSQPVPICYASAQVAPGLLIPGEVPEGMLVGLSEQIVLTLYNNTTSTMEIAHERIRQVIHPRMVPGYDAARKLERDLMNSHRLATQLMITSTRVGKSGDSLAARVDGIRRVYAGAIVLREEELGAIIHFQQTTPSEMNPWGVLITRLAFTEPLRGDLN